MVHPNWPTMFPRLLTDGKLEEDVPIKNHRGETIEGNPQYPLSKKQKQYLWECEEERFVFKSCLRSVLSLRRSNKHTSWDTAEVANLQLS